MKKSVSVLLILALLCTLTVPALASEALFPSVNTYPAFADVPDGTWYSDGVKTCYEVGLMNGTDSGFQPSKVLTVAEVAAIAARIQSTITGKAIPDAVTPSGETAPWYQKYVDFLEAHGIDVPTPTQNATRQDLVDLLRPVVPTRELTAINTVQSLPDTDDTNFLKFFNAGVITGVNDYGTALPQKTLTRAECAVLLSRLVRPSLRVTSTLTAPSKSDPDFSATQYLMGLDEEETVFTWCGISVTAGTYYSVLYSMYGSLLQQCNSQGVAFSWGMTIGSAGNTMSAAQYLSAYAPIYALQETWAATPAGIAAKAAIPVYKAKHILVTDQALARQIAEQLAADPSKFDSLLAQYGADPGMKSNPDGYVFGPGEMVSEFEAGTAALAVGEISAPIQSAFGYHIILRLAPTAQEEADYRKSTFPAQAFDDATAPYVGTAPSFPIPVDVKAVCDGMVKLANLD